MDASRDLIFAIKNWKIVALSLGVILLFTMCFTVGLLVKSERLADGIDQLNQRIESVEATYVSIVRACEREKHGQAADEATGETISGEPEPSNDPKPFPADESGGERQVILLKYTKKAEEAAQWKEDYAGTFDLCSLADSVQLKLCVKPVRNGEIYAALLVADGLGSNAAAKAVSCLLETTYRNVKPKPETRKASLYTSPDCL